jgi:RimJ/RimL family protein N-acetyltransferase
MFSRDLEGATLRLRALGQQHRDGLYAAASDPLIWEQHPAKTRYQRDVFDPYFDFLISTESALAVFDKSKDRIIGASRYYTAPHPPDSHSIGFTFLTRPYWGGKANFELKTLMVEEILRHSDAAWFHVGPENLRSQKATEKLGALRVDEARLDLGNGPSDYVCFQLTRKAWAARRADD